MQQENIAHLTPIRSVQNKTFKSNALDVKSVLSIKQNALKDKTNQTPLPKKNLQKISKPAFSTRLEPIKDEPVKPLRIRKGTKPKQARPEIQIYADTEYMPVVQPIGNIKSTTDSTFYDAELDVNPEKLLKTITSKPIPESDIEFEPVDFFGNLLVILEIENDFIELEIPAEFNF